MKKLNPKFGPETGLIVAIIQDFKTKEVLMQAFMNKEAWELTLRDLTVWFWSRSRQELWHKGDTSGNFLEVKEITLDCDSDSVLISAKVLGDGNACHYNKVSCFFKQVIKKG